MEDLIERLFAFMECKGLTQNRFEQECGLAHTNLREKKQGPTADYLMKIVTRFPDLNLNWLIAGRGPMLIQGQPLPTPQNDIHNNQVFIANWGDLKEIIADVIKTQSK